MSYTQTITIAKNTDVDTIEKALALVNTTNPVIYISDGEYDIEAMYLMSKANTTITWVGKGIYTTIYLHKPGNMLNFKGPVHFLKIKFECANDMPVYATTRYVMAYWTDATKVTFENCIFNVSKDGLKPNYVFFFLHNSQNDFISNKTFINCTFNAKGITGCVGSGRGTFRNCLYNTNAFSIVTNSSTITNCIKDDINQSTYMPVNIAKTTAGVYGGANAISLISERIRKEVKKIFDNNELFQQHCVKYEVEEE